MDRKFDVESLITLIEERPAIWDKTLEIYKNKVVRESAWHEICIALNEDFEEMDIKQRQEFGKIILKKWTQIRDSWCKDVKKRKNKKKTGISASIHKPYKYSDQLSFLKKIFDTTICQESGQGGDGSDEEEEEGSSNHAEEQTKSTTSGEIQKNRNTPISDKEKKLKKRKEPEVEEEKRRFIDGANTRTEDPQLLFFKSLLPVTATLNTEETLEFQAGVINLLQTIKRQRRNN